MNLGEAIKTWRKHRGFTQGVLAYRSRISVNALSQIEIGTTFPQPKTLDRICKALDVPKSYIFFFCLDETDLPKAKRTAFKYLVGSIKNLLMIE